MDKKRDPLFIGIAIAGLIVSSYALYRTLFDQIISRNQGLLYATVFGFILFLVFLLCNLFTKLIATSNNSQKDVVIKYVSLGVLLVLGAFFVYSRLRYTNSVDAYDSLFYKNAVAMNSDNYAANKDLILAGIKNPSLYVYSLVLSVLFKIFGEASIVIIVANIFFCLLSGLLVYLITSLLANRLSALFVIALSVIMPTTTFVVYSYSGESFFTFLFLLFIYIFTIFFVKSDNYCLAYDLLPYGDEIVARKKAEKEALAKEKAEKAKEEKAADSKKTDEVNAKNGTESNGKGLNKRVSNKQINIDIDVDVRNKVYAIILTVLYSFLAGVLIFVEPVIGIVLLGFIIVFYFLKKECTFNLFIGFAAALFIFAIFTFGKSIHMSEDFGTVIAGEANCFNFFDDFSTGEKSEFSQVITNFNYELAVTDKDVTSNYNRLVTSNGEVAYTDSQIAWVVVANQIVYMYLLVMFISCLFIGFYHNKSNIIVVCLLLISGILIIFFQQNRINSKNFFINILLIACGLSIHYLYLNHHPELRPSISAIDVLNNSQSNIPKQKSVSYSYVQNSPEEDEFVRRAQALIFVGPDETLYKQIKEEELKKALSEGKIKPLDNTYDDYDEDYFLDNTDDDKNNKEENQKLKVALVTNFKIKNKENLLDLGSNPKKVDKNKPKSSNSEIPDTENGRFISNPLPVPKKKAHEQIDFDIQNLDGSWDWDIDFDVKADDDF